MATIKSRFDVSSPDLDHLDSNKTPDDGPWLSTYSRGLCHIFPKDEDDCWDAMLSSQYPRTIEDPVYNTTSSTISVKEYSTSTVSGDTVIRPQPQSNRPYHRRYHTSLASTDAMAARSARSATPRPSAALTLEEESLISTAPTLSPASLSHALCSVGFNCIDYFTATKDDPEETSSTLSINRHRSTPAQDGFDDSSLVAGDWAAAVCGKRTAALERKRVLSRSSSQEAVNVNNDPWFATLDRLSRWDEVAYR
ncbi:hypothetical protein BG006_001301 [Podila minutissima]|uniref:Uncharacterized protein n=1 Tax=Podila minutissima TaxID=64525 RepID=A0A9P5VP40_9FUNG|nr:hypothetical protein BG006_001301 [Podila minutissima]